MPTPEITVFRQEIALPRSHPHTVSAPRLARIGLRTLLLALASGGLLWLCYFPVAWGWLAWISLVPMLALVRSPARPWVIYLSAWAGGLVFCWPVLQWMRVADPRMYFTWMFLATYCSLYFPLAVYLIRFFGRRTSVPLVVAVPVVWTALEFFRSTFGTGFGWYLLGHTQHDVLPVIQIADLTGAYGVTFLVAAVNALLFETLYGHRWFRAWLSGDNAPPRWSRTALLAQGLTVLLALTGTVAYGSWRLGQDRMRPGPGLALVQGNLDQRIRNLSAVADEAAHTVANHFIELSDLASHYRPDLIVWPETSYPQDWEQEADGTPTEHTREIARRMGARWRTSLLVGMNSFDHDGDGHGRRYNSAVLVDRHGKSGGRYDKMHRVPFGEYVPLRDWLPWMNSFAPYDFDYSVWPGREYTRFPLADASTGRHFTFGVLICYEDTDAEMARPYEGGDGQPPADFLLNISNDGWFDGTSEHDEHLAICRFRAVECRRSVARSVNMGISAIIDGNGRVRRSFEFVQPNAKTDLDSRSWRKVTYPGSPELPVSRWGEYKKVSGVLLAVIPVDDRVSLYARWGDWLPWLCWITIGSVFSLVIVRRIAKPRMAA
jgi:apolipoprotein N-acyltransferase